MTTKQMMLLVAVAAAMLGWPQVTKRLQLQLGHLVSIPALMAGLSGNESSLFSERAAACRSLASSGIPWDQEGKEREALRLCPHQIQEPEHGSWTEQAGGWERAASIARRASVRSRFRAKLCNLWGYWPAVAPISLLGLFLLSWFFLGRLDRSSSGRSTRRWSRIVLIFVVVGILMWMFPGAPGR